MYLLSIGSTTLESIGQFISVLLIFVFVLFITYLTTRWVARYQQGNITNKNIKVIETYKVTTNKFIQIVKIGEKYVAIGICKDSITKLTELTEEQILDYQIENELKNDESFGSILEKIKGLKPKK